MKYQASTGIWEVTMGCNMHCKHCGSSCSTPLPDELSTEEALDLCDQIADLGLLWITLSGGEPLIRKDTPLLVKRLRERGVQSNMITNGWLLTEERVNQLQESGIATVAISLDGPEEIHDSIRRPGAFAHAQDAFARLKKYGIHTGAVTTVTKQNLHHLGELKGELLRMGVGSWQLQIGLPMGNLKERPDWIITPDQVNDLINFCHQTAVVDHMRIFTACCVGYYTQKELDIKRIAFGTDTPALWDGCNAGIRGFGILQNGDIVGCTSVRSADFIEGNIRETPLRQIWEDENRFIWRRNMTKDKLGGLCRTCNYASKCLGGCANTRLTTSGSVYAENEYCAYHLVLRRMEQDYAACMDSDHLYRTAMNLMDEKNYQEAGYAFRRLTGLSPALKDAWSAYAYCEYMCGNYDSCLYCNEQALNLDPCDANALNGKELALKKLGRAPEMTAAGTL